MDRVTEGRFVSEKVRKNLLKGFVVTKECKEAKEKLSKVKKGKQAYFRVFSGRIIKKYRHLKLCKDILPMKSAQKGRTWEDTSKKCDILTVTFATPQSVLKKREAVRAFFNSDRASHFAPGKKDFVVVDKQKVQKRYLNDTMSALYPKFAASSSVVVSFSTFCQYRPKHVVTPKFTGRDTCLCVHCENFKYLVKSLKDAKVISEKSREEVFSTLCCDSGNKNCLLRTCSECASKKIIYDATDKDAKLHYEKWVSCKKEMLNKPASFMKITKKDKVEATVQQVIDIFEEQLVGHMAHVGRIIHQRETVKLLRENLTEKDLCVIVDWSENWSCKYFSEVQSMHFGGSHQQLALHTGAVIGKGSYETFCTVSESTDHGPKNILAHLKPILLKYATDKTENLHFVSDGPSTQYRNCKMFYLVATEICKILPLIKRITWNFSESNHGKSEADGAGGTVKRTADNLVALGKDICDINVFVKQLNERCPKIFVRLISNDEINFFKDVNIESVQPFKGTLRVHQYNWKKESPLEIRFKSLSCYDCYLKETPDECNHFDLGVMNLFEKEKTVGQKSRKREKPTRVEKKKPAKRAKR